MSGAVGVWLSRPIPLWENIISDKLEAFWKGVAFLNSLPAKSVLAGMKVVLFGRYVLKFFVGIVQKSLREMKTRRATIYLTIPNNTTHKLANIS